MSDEVGVTLTVTTASTDITMTVSTDSTGINPAFPRELWGRNRRDTRAALKKRGLLYQWKWGRLGYL